MLIKANIRFVLVLLYINLTIFFSLPILLDAVSQNSPRVIDDTQTKKLAASLKNCCYYETCAMYGLNVDRVFQDGKRHILDRMLKS